MRKKSKKQEAYLNDLEKHVAAHVNHLLVPKEGRHILKARSHEPPEVGSMLQEALGHTLESMRTDLAKEEAAENTLRILLLLADRRSTTRGTGRGGGGATRSSKTSRPAWRGSHGVRVVANV